MIFSQDRQTLRRSICEAWRKARAREPLEPLEAMIANVIEEHPEYHAALEHTDAVEADYDTGRGETNPFLHLALHIAVREQLAMQRPLGILNAHQALLARLGNAHAAEHAMIACLEACLADAQRTSQPPDETAYLASLRRRAE